MECKSEESDVLRVVLSIDVGSSSIRCTAYQIQTKGNTKPSIKSIPGCAVSRDVSCVEPGSGNIILSRIHPSTNEDISLFDDIDACIDETVEALRQTKQQFRIRGVGMTTFVMNLIGISSSSELCGDEFTLSYACNSPSVRNQCLILKERLGTEILEHMYQRTGTPLHTSYATAQLKDLYERRSKDCKDVKVWLSIAAICISRWTNTNMLNMPISYSEASWTGLLDFRTGQWDEESLSVLSSECRQSLPKVENKVFEMRNSTTRTTSSNHDNDNSDITPGRETKNSYLQRWPEMGPDVTASACNIYSGYGDGACANIGTKCTSTDRIAVTIGTSAAARICIPFPLCDVDKITDRSKHNKRQKISFDNEVFKVENGLFCYRIDRSTILLGGALTDGGSVIAWLRNLFNLQSQSAFLDCQNKADESYTNISYEGSEAALHRGKHLVFVPFLSGERSTGYREDANGCLMGLTRSTTSAHILQESMESIVLRINAILQLIKSSSNCIASGSGYSVKNTCIISSGNALEKNELWRRMLADCSNMNVLIDNDSNEGTSRGAALLVAKALADLSNNCANCAHEVLSIKCKSEPNKGRQLYWAKKKKEQEALISKLEPLWGEHE